MAKAKKSTPTTVAYASLATAQDMAPACALYLDSVYGQGLSNALPHLVQVVVKSVCHGICEKVLQQQFIGYGLFPKNGLGA